MHGVESVFLFNPTSHAQVEPPSRLRRLVAERKIAQAASDHAETLPFEASPIARSLSKDSVFHVDSQSPTPFCRSLSAEFQATKVTEPSPGEALKLQIKL